MINPLEQASETVPGSLAWKQGVDWDETKDKFTIINTLINSWIILKFIVRIKGFSLWCKTGKVKEVM